MRLVVIVEHDLCVATKAAAAAKFVDVEDVIDVRGLITQKFLRHVTSGAFFDILTVFFANPAHASDIPIENGGKFAAAKARDVDVLTRFAGNRKNFVDGEVGMIAPVALKAG